eukprot:1147473-Pelagomonas_calceolata.AAC.3
MGLPANPPEQSQELELQKDVFHAKEVLQMTGKLKAGSGNWLPERQSVKAIFCALLNQPQRR